MTFPIYFFSYLNLYIVKNFFKNLGLCALGIGVIIALFDVLELLRRMLTHPSLEMSSVIEILLLRLPSELQKMLPFIILAAAMLTLTKLNGRREIVIMRSCGISIGQMLGGLSIAIFCFGIINITLFDSIRATFTERLYSLEDKLFGSTRSTMSVNASGLWLKETFGDEERLFHAQKVDLKRGEFNNVTMFAFDKTNTFLGRLDVNRAIIDDKKWHLSTVQFINQEGVQTHQAALTLPTDLTLKKIRESNAEPHTLPLWSLASFIKILEKSGLSTLSYRMHFHKIMAQVGLFFVMILIAAGFCLRSSRTAKTSHLVSICLLVGLLFHFLTDFLYALGLGERLPPLVATWLPVFMGACLSLALLLHVEHGHHH